MGTSLVQHIFVLMLENRSFDHMLGFSGLRGTDAEIGGDTRINGLTGTEQNVFNGQPFPVTRGADFRMPTDPAHEFDSVLHQLAGPNAAYPRGGPYPTIDNSGYVASYVNSGGSNPGELMKCFTPAQLPVLTALAQEFVVCDNWHASLPGSTWPNRMFVHAASSAGLEHSPSGLEIAEWEIASGFSFPHGSIFDALQRTGVRRRLYGGDDFPMVSALKGIHLDDIRHFSDFPNDLKQPSFPFSYIFIEPSYDVLNDYKNGTSQHPLADVTHGEALIKTTYEAIRNSSVWPNSMLIITWDEHGGFFDHAKPPAAAPPGDTDLSSKFNKSGFTFDRYGPRVPAVVVSPLIKQNLIDHRLYDHASIPRLVEDVFGLSPLTDRDAASNPLLKLVTLSEARQNAPPTLPPPADSGAGVSHAMLAAVAAPTALSVARATDDVNEGNLPMVVFAAMQQDLAASPPSQRDAILARVQAIRTRGQAQEYLEAVRRKVQASRA